MRQTQNLSAPPTQNTAPVFEFRCLYTNDVRQKKKRWRDGFLRFHTFNKRIMVYEAPSRNYIGDQHWREDGIVQDGDELQLGRPVLVQVGEAVGEMETDLTEMLEKRKKPQQRTAENVKDHLYPESVHVSAPISPAMARAPTGQPPQLQAKSLNVLLGTPKGPIGRASVPTKSPHEIRRENENTGWEPERAIKRQRMDPQPHAQSVSSVRPVFRTPATVTPQATCTGSKEKLVLINQNEKEPSYERSEKVTRAPQSKSLRPTGMQPTKKAFSESVNTPVSRKQDDASRPDTASKPVGKSVIDDEAPSHATKIPRDPETTIVSRQADSTSSETRPAESIVRLLDIIVDQEPASFGKPEKKRTRLQITSHKPRKKLMYRDLLPQDPAPARQLLSSDRDASRKVREGGAPRRPSRSAKDRMLDFHEEEQNQLSDRLNRNNERTVFCDNGPDVTADIGEDSLSLFVSQEDIPSTPTRHHEKPHRPASNRSPKNKSTEQQQAVKVRKRPENTIPKPKPAVHDTSLTLAKLDEILFPSSKSPPHRRTPSPIQIDDEDPPVNALPPSSILKTPLRSTPRDVTPEARVSTTLVPSSPGFQTPSSTSEQNASPRRPSVVPTGSKSHPEPLPKNPVSKEATYEQAFPKPTTEATTVEKASPTRPHARIQPPDPSARPSPAPIEPRPEKTRPNSPPKETTQTIQPPHSTHPRSPPQKPSPPSNPPSPQPATPNPDPHEANLTIHQKPLPAFQAPRARPKPRPRSPLKKSASDTTTSTRPALPLQTSTSNPPQISIEHEKSTDATTPTPWSKEAWDLFGCGRDGMQCTYEEFKRKEGLI